MSLLYFCFSSRRRHTRCALVTGVQTCALPISLGEAGLLYPDWPVQWGGRGADPASTRASLSVWQEIGYAGLPRSTTSMIGHVVQKTAKPELKEEVLLRMGRDENSACLGYTEPSGERKSGGWGKRVSGRVDTGG